MTDDIRKPGYDRDPALRGSDPTVTDETLDETTPTRTADTASGAGAIADETTSRRHDYPGAPATRPEWDREEWEGQNQGHRTGADAETRGAVDAELTDATRWNEHQVVGEGQGAADEGPNERVVPTEGENELSGHGHNPGGGERWADVDRDPHRG